MILLHELQVLRIKLFEMAEARGSLTDPEVIAISEAADEVIVTLQQLHKEEQAKYNTRCDLAIDGKIELAGAHTLAEEALQAAPFRD
ncbi:aspartyl-phosphate phosphatase Spo0E family protein [Paenibacillus taihuensis]|nr:aspartyl-phosphate phosphatase Spo0E family protein [Paenibacillus taihuensis]